MASTNSIILASVRFMQFFHLCLKKGCLLKQADHSVRPPGTASRLAPLWN